MTSVSEQLRHQIVEAAVKALNSGWSDTERAELAGLVHRYETLPSRSLDIVGHAVERFKQRSGCKNSGKARRTIENLLDGAEEVSVRDRFKVVQLLNHDFRDARYLRNGGWIFVVVDTMVVTCHHGTARRWAKIENQERSVIHA